MEASGPGGGHRAQEARLEKGSEDPPEAALPSITWASICFHMSQPPRPALSEYDSQEGDVAETATQFKLRFIC